MHLLIHSRDPADPKRECRTFQGAETIYNIRIVAAVAIVFASLAAHAQGTAPDSAVPTHWKFGIQPGTVKDNARIEPVIQLSFGYNFDRTWSVEALADVNMLFIRDGARDTGPYEFDHAFGVRGLATLPLSPRWDLVGGLGLVTIHEQRGLDIYGASRDRTDAVVSLSAMYRGFRHWSMGVEASTFARTHSLDLGLRGEVNF